jgi:Holliday junction resolvase RusA-like endonuclease
MEIRFMVPGIPTAWARARTNGKRHFTAPKQGRAMAIVEHIAHAAMAGEPPLDGPLSMSVQAVWPWPKSWSEKKRRVAGSHYKTSRPDADNIAKLIGDSLNEIVFRDDAQVVKVSVTKTYGITAGTHVIISMLIED